MQTHWMAVQKHSLSIVAEVCTPESVAKNCQAKGRADELSRKRKKNLREKCWNGDTKIQDVLAHKEGKTETI